MADYLTEGRINLSLFFVVKVIHNLVTFKCKRKQLNLDLFNNLIFYQHFIINKNLRIWIKAFKHSRCNGYFIICSLGYETLSSSYTVKLRWQTWSFIALCVMSLGKVSSTLFRQWNLKKALSYMAYLKKSSPQHSFRFSDQAWLRQDRTADHVLRRLHER